MENDLVNYFQHLPCNLNPTAFTLGFFSIGWYSLMYLAGFFVMHFLLQYRLRKKESAVFNSKTILNLLLYIFIGLIAGARFGYVLFYNPSYYLRNPLEIISPFDPQTGELIGIYGMSYHGGLIGAIIASLIFIKKHRLSFWQLSDFIIPAIPAGYFFGRIGNFLNGELYGRITDKPWGMYFPEAVRTGRDLSLQLRHPSQLYEAVLEGLLIFLILWPLRNNPKLKNKFFGLYLAFYAIARIIAEFFREPDKQIGYVVNFLTLGQILSLFMLIAGLFLIFYSQKTKKMLD